MVLSLAAAAALLTGCGLLRHPPTSPSSGSVTPVQANPGERQGTVPAADAKQQPPADPAASPQQAVQRFAVGYINWSYTSLASDQARLAASAVGAARSAELQAQAQTGRDTPLRRGHIYNTGTVVAVSRVAGGPPSEWVIVTREQSGGDQEYAGVGSSFHVTLATVQRVAGGFAVSAWHPQV
jgi:hypothetical protein